MGVRKNARYLSGPEREDFVRACVMVKADIVNPGDPVSQQYDRWDLFVAIHRMIQNAFSPGASAVNFGHGGSGAYSFFSWHRYFLLQLERELQRWVPGVMLPYWDWTDPTPLLTDDFLGPNGSSGTQTVDSGYFAGSAPGTGSNPTPAPAWWPSSLTGWNLSTAFPSFWQGALRRDIGGSLPSPDAIQEALNMTTYPAFQNAVESGNGLSPANFHQMHNGLHGFIGGHMSSPTASPFDPIFYMHHCNIDRYWAMWQRDGNAGTYPTSGGDPEHHRNDIMYPWTGGTSGYGTNVSMPPIQMPDFSALGAQRNVDTLDHRALGYTYDTSAHPSWLMLPSLLKMTVNHLGDARMWSFLSRRDFGYFLAGSRHPFLTNGDLYGRGYDPARPALTVLPLPSTPARMACWHTLAFMFDWPVFERILKACLASLDTFYYLVHPADLAQPADLDPSMKLHLERLEVPLATKIGHLERAIEHMLSDGRRIVTMKTLARHARQTIEARRAA